MSVPALIPKSIPGSARRVAATAFAVVAAVLSIAAGPAIARPPAPMLARMTPDQRAQFQQQMAEMRNRRGHEGSEAPAAGHPKMSVEERRQLREQIRDAHRDWNGSRPAGQRER